MSNVIDERVLEMRFDNAQFKQAAGESLNVLQKLGKAIDQSTTEKNVGKIAKSIEGINFGSAVSGVEALTQRFSALGIVGKRVIENITDGIMGKFSSAVHSMTSSIISGGINRAMNIENARFQLQGVIDKTKALEAGFKDAGEMVEMVMKQAGDSVDGTAYSYDAAAKAASMFAASGVKAGTQMEQSLTAIAGVSATFNANYEDISNIFTTVAGQGKVMADQLNQLSFRGMNAAASIAQFFNQVKKDPSIASEEVQKAVNSFSKGTETTEADIRDLVKKGKINFDIFSEAMAVTFGKHAKDANKTFTGSMANIRAALARTGEMFVAPLINENGSFVRLFNSIRKKINEFNAQLKPLAKQITTFVNGTVKYISRVVDNIHVTTIAHSLVMALEGVGNILKGLMTYLRPIRDAFQETFGGFTYKNIIDAGRAFKNFTSGFKASDKAADAIKTAFKGVFDVVNMLINVFLKLAGVMSPASESASSFGDSFLDATKSLGETLSAFAKFVNESDAVNAALATIHDVAVSIIDVFGKIGSTVAGAFSSINASSIASVFDAILHPIQSISDLYNKIKGGGLADAIKNITDRFRGFRGVGEDSSAILSTMATGLNKVKETINQFKPENLNFSPLKVVAEGLQGAFEGIGKAIAFIGGKAAEGIKSVFDALTGKRESKVAEALATAIMKIGDALAYAIKNGHPIQDLLSGLNKIIEAGLLMNLNGLITMLKNLTRMKFNNNALQGIANVLDNIKVAIPRLTTGLVRDMNAMARLIDAKAIQQLALSIGLLAGALFVLSLINPDQLAVGIGAITVMLAELVGIMVVFQKVMQQSEGIKGALTGLIDAVKVNMMAGALLQIGIAVIALSVAIKMLSSLSWEEIAKGLGTVTVLLFELAAVAKIMQTSGSDKSIALIGGTLLAVGISIIILAKAVKMLGSLDVDTLIRGLTSVGVLMLELAAFTRLTQKGNMGETALSIVVIAAALRILVGAVKQLGEMRTDQLIQGLLAIGAALAALTIALNYMKDNGAIANAFAAIELAAAMWIVAQSLKSIAEINPEKLLNSVLALCTVMFGIVLMINNLNPTKAVANAFAVIELAVALLMIAKALEPLSACNPAGLIASVIAMGILLVTMAGALSVMSLIGNPVGLLAGGLAAIEMAAAMLIIAKSLEPLAAANPAKLIVAVVAMGIVLAEMVAALAITTLIGPMGLLGALAAIEMAAAMLIIAKSLEPLAAAKPFNLLIAVKAMGIVLAEMVAALGVVSLFGPLAMVGGLAAIEMAAAMCIVAQALLPLTKVDAEALDHAVDAMCEMLKNMAKRLRKIAWGKPEKTIAAGAAAIEMAAAMWIVAQALMPLTGVDANSLDAAVDAMCKIMTKMMITLMGLGVMAPFAVAGGLAALEMAGSMRIIGEVLTGLSTIPYEDLMNSVKGLAAALAVLAGCTTLMGVVAPLIVAGSAALLVAGLSLSATMFVLAPALDRMVTTLNTLATVDADALGARVPTIAKSIALLGLSLKAFGPLAFIGANALVTVADGITKLAPPMKAFSDMNPDVLARAFVEIGGGIREFGASLKSFGVLSGIGAGSLNTVADAVMKLAPALMILSKVPGDGIQAVMSSLSTGFSEFGEALKSFGFFSGIGAGALSQLANSIAVMAPALMTLSMVPGDQIATVMGSLGAGFKLFGEALKETPFFFANGRADALTSLCDGVQKLTSVLPTLSGLDAETIKTDLEAIGTAFESFGTALGNTPVLFTGGRAEAIGTLCDQMKKLADGIMYFINTVGYSGAFEPILTAIGEAFQSFGTAISNAPLFNSADRANSIGILCDQLMDLASGIGYFMNMNFDPEAFSTALGQVGTAFATFGASLQSSPIFNTSDRAEGVATLIDTLTELTDGMNYFTQNIDGEGFSSSLESIRKAFFTFSQALANTPWFKADERAGSIKTMIDNIKSLAAGVNYFQTITTEGADTTLATIGKAMVDFGDAIKKTPFWNAEGRSAALTSVISSMNDLATAITKLSWVQGVEKQMGALAGGVQVLGDAFVNNWSGVSDDHVTNFGNAITTIQTIAGIDSESLIKVNDGLRNMLSWINTLINMDTEKMSTFSQALTQLANEGVQAFTQAFADTAGGSTSGPLGNFVNQIASQLKGKATVFMQPGNDAGRAYFAGIRAIASSDGPVAAIDVVNAICSAISALEGKFRDEGIKSATAYINAIAAQDGKARDAGTKLAGAVLETLSKMADEFRKVGVNCVQGFANGLADEKAVQAVIAKATALGTQSIAATKKATNQNSPSKAFRYLGEMCGVGFANGLSAMTQVVDEAGANLGKGSIKSLNDAINSIYALVDDYMEVDPTIRPTVDMSNIRRATDETTRLFNQAIGRTTLNAEIASAGIVRQRQTSSPEEIQNGTTNAGGNTYNFIQNNRSPKALSRVEIYRDTKSLFKQYREAVEGV